MFIVHTKAEETAVQIYDEGYSINMSCPLNLICGFFLPNEETIFPGNQKS